MTKEEAILKHYIIQRDALDDIKDKIATFVNRPGITEAELLREIEDIAADASEVDLTNPHGIEKSIEYIANLPSRAGLAADVVIVAVKSRLE